MADKEFRIIGKESGDGYAVIPPDGRPHETQGFEGALSFIIGYLGGNLEIKEVSDEEFEERFM